MTQIITSRYEIVVNIQTKANNLQSMIQSTKTQGGIKKIIILKISYNNYMLHLHIVSRIICYIQITRSNK